MRGNPFKGHRFPRDIILVAVRWYCRCPLSYADVRDLLAERGIDVDRATIYRWVQKFGLRLLVARITTEVGEACCQERQ